MLSVGIGSFLLLLIVVYLIAVPALAEDPGDGGSAPGDLLARKEHLFDEIRELDADLATGKLDESDHRRFRALAVADAAETLRALDEAEAGAAPGTGSKDEGEPVDRFEALISARKRELEGRSCPSCASEIDRDDVFCRRCGSALATGAIR